MLPDASKHNPDPAYIRTLIEQAGLSQRGAARQIGVSERMMRSYCAPTDVSTHSAAPYCVQFALECLADENKQ